MLVKVENFRHMIQHELLFPTSKCQRIGGIQIGACEVGFGGFFTKDHQSLIADKSSGFRKKYARGCQLTAIFKQKFLNRRCARLFSSNMQDGFFHERRVVSQAASH